MTKIKLCGLMRPCDIDWANELMPDYVGFVFAKKSRRYISFDTAKALRARLSGDITPVGVFVDEDIDRIAALVTSGIIGAVQLHGKEDNAYIDALFKKISVPVIKAFKIESEDDIITAGRSLADYVMLDSGGGTGKAFDHSLCAKIQRDFFLAGGLDAENVCAAIEKYRPYAVDTSSALETGGEKDKEKMAAFVNAVRHRKDEKR